MAEKKQAIVQYQASDGTSVKLTPAIVAKYIITGNTEASDRDIFAFMTKCQARGLNLLAGDAYMTVFKNKDGSTSTSVIVSKDYFVRTANQQPTFDGMRAGVIVHNKKTGELTYREGCLVGKATEVLVGGWAEAYDKGRSVPSRAEVSMDEYDQHRSLWRTKPATMIRKVALVQALRELYPQAFGGVYDRDEMPEPATEIPEEPIAITAGIVAEEVAQDPHADQRSQEPAVGAKTELVDEQTGEVVVVEELFEADGAYEQQDIEF